MTSNGKIITVVVVALLFIAGILGCIDGFATSGVSLYADNIEMVYGDRPDISNFTIEECSRILKRKTNVSPTLDMVEYDPEYIGVQEAKFVYKKESISFSLTIKPKQLNSPVISCRDGIVDWSDDRHASKYLVNINGTDYVSLTSEYDLNVFSYITGEINIKVKSVALNNKYENSKYSNTLSFNKLDKVSNIIYENGKIKWSSVSNASKYFVWINGIKYDSPINELEFSDFVVGPNEIKIQAYGHDSYISSNVFTDSLIKYSMVSNIRYEDGMIKWDSTNTNCSYEISINGNILISENKYYEIEFDCNVIYSVKIRAVSKDSKHIDSEYSNLLSFNKLNAVSNIIYENGKIKWSSVSNATKYFVWINGIKYDSLTNELEFSDFVVGPNEIKIQAYGHDSYISSSVFTDSLTKYSKVSNIRYENGMIKWDSTNINCSYEISINGNISISENKYYEIALDQNVVYSVKVRAISNDSKHIDSDFSNINEITYHKLLEPTIQISTGDYGNTYDVIISEVENANEYQVEVKLYTTEGIYSTNTYVLTDNLTKEISVTASIVKIEVSVVAKDTNGVFDQSDVVTKSRDI